MPALVGFGSRLGLSGTNPVVGGGGSSGGVPYGALNPTDFGVIGNGIADDTAALINYIAACNAENVAVVMQAGATYLVNSSFAVTLFVPFFGNGSVFLIPNDGQSVTPFAVAPRPADVVSVDLATVNTWTSMYQGSGRIPEITSIDGVCIHLVSTDSVFIGRSAPIGTGTPIGETFIVEANFNNNPSFGNTSPTQIPTTVGFLNGVIRENWGPLLPLTDVTCTQETIRPQLLIDGLNVRLIAGTDPTNQMNRAAVCTRTNTVFRSCSVQCVSGYMLQGFTTGNCGLVTFEDCWVQGLGVTSTNYGFNFGYACHHTLINCYTNGCRRGLDGTGANYVKVIGGNWPDGIGAHWGRSFYIYGATLGCSNNSNPRNILFSGSDLICENCDFWAGYLPSFSAALGQTIDIMRMREDLPEWAGIAAIRGGRIILDNTGATTGKNVPLFNIMNFGTINAQNTGRTVYLPDSIELKPDQIIQYGAGSTTTINLLNISPRLIAADFSHNISTQGTFEIDVGAFDLATGYFKLDGVTPFLQVNLFKSDTSIGPIGTGYIRNCQAITVFAPIADASAATNVGRWDIIVDNVGYLNVVHYYYVLRYLKVNFVPIMLVSPLQDGSFGVTSVGDESWNYDPTSVKAGVVPTQSTQAAGTAIAAGVTQVVPLIVNRAVVLPPSIGAPYVIINGSAFDLRVYPNIASQIDALGLNAFYTLAATQSATFRATTLTQWYSEPTLNPVRLPSYAVSSLPSAVTFIQCLLYVSDGTANQRLAISDGTNWRFPSGTIVS